MGSSGLNRFLQVSTGWVTVSFLYNIWDYLIFPAAIWEFGPFWGGSLMGIADLIVCVALIIVYVSQKKDWLGFELAKKWITSLDSTRWVGCALKWCLGHPFLSFVVLSWRYDPFITTAFFASPGSQKLKARQWMIFVASWLFGNSSWTAICFSGIESLKYFLRSYLLAHLGAV